MSFTFAHNAGHPGARMTDVEYIPIYIYIQLYIYWQSSRTRLGKACSARPNKHTDRAAVDLTRWGSPIRLLQLLLYNRGVAIGMVKTRSGHLGGHGYVDTHCMATATWGVRALLPGYVEFLTALSLKERYKEKLRLIGGKDAYENYKKHVLRDNVDQ